MPDKNNEINTHLYLSPEAMRALIAMAEKDLRSITREASWLILNEYQRRITSGELPAPIEVAV